MAETEQETYPVSYVNLSSMLLCAVRYALPRHTYVTSEARDWIVAYSHHLRDGDLKVIHKDIYEVLRKNQVSEVLHDCDVEEWRRSLDYIESVMVSRGMGKDAFELRIR